MKNRVKDCGKNTTTVKNGKHAENGKPAAPPKPAKWTPRFSNYSNDEPLPIDAICDSLLKLAGGWPKCVSGALCYTQKGEIRVLEDSAALFAWIASHAPVDWRRGAQAVTKEEFFKRLHQRERWAWSTPHPHFPPLPGVLYLAEPPEAENTGKLDELVDRFRPKTDKDGELIKALVLTFFWGGPPGKRPQFAIVADESQDADAGRGTGKTTLPQYLSELVGGCIDVDPGDDRNRICSNLLSFGSWGRRIVLIDNLKTTRFSHDLLEKLVTRDEITGHRLYQGFASRPNWLTWVVTVNGAYFSTDQAQRSVVIRVDRPSDTPEDWDAQTLKFIRRHREDVIADIRWHLEEQKPESLKKVDRWRAWCLGVLSRCTDTPDALLKHILKERKAIDADKQEIELALDHLRGCIAVHFEEHEKKEVNVDNSLVWAPTAWFVQALRALKRDLTDRQAQQFLARLASSGRLRESRTKTQRGYLHIGAGVDDPEDAPPVRYIRYQPDVPALRKK